jgi:ABC-type lipoprotein release transport system permease subunit
LFLFLALSFGFSVVTLITSVKDDMYENVYRAAQAHYAGDIVAVGYDQNVNSFLHLTENEADVVLKTAEESGIYPVHFVRRTHFPDRGLIYFNGTAVRLKYIIGVDWDNEASYLRSLDYRDSFDVDTAGADDMVLSAPVADQLGVGAGDSVIVEVETRWGQKNTGVFIVKGIVNDSSIFGYYKMYVPRQTLNRLLLFDDADCSIIGIFTADKMGMEQKQRILHNALSQVVPAGPLINDRKELVAAAVKGAWEGTEIFVISLPIYLSEVADLLGAMNILSYILYAMMLLIILVSAAVTYRLLLHERARELGTMRVIGFQERDLRFVLTAESFGLILASIAGGFVLNALLSWGVSFIPFSWFPSFEIFLKEGKLHTLYLPKTVMINIISIIVMMFFAVFFPAYRTSRQTLTRLLSGGGA